MGEGRYIFSKHQITINKCIARNKDRYSERITLMFEFHSSTGRLWPGRGRWGSCSPGSPRERVYKCAFESSSEWCCTEILWSKTLQTWSKVTQQTMLFSSILILKECAAQSSFQHICTVQCCRKDRSCRLWRFGGHSVYSSTVTSCFHCTLYYANCTVCIVSNTQNKT